MRPHLAKKLARGPHVLQHIASGMFLKVHGWEIEWGNRADRSCPIFTLENMGPDRVSDFHVMLYRNFRQRSRPGTLLVLRCELVLPELANAELDERDRLAKEKERATKADDIVKQNAHVAYVRAAIHKLRIDFQSDMADLVHELGCAESNLAELMKDSKG